MIKKITYILLALIIVLFTWSALGKSFGFQPSNPNKDKLLLELISYVVNRGHFDPKAINDELSEQLYTAYLELLDGQKRFFLKSDIKEFSRYMYQLDDQFNQIDISFFNLTYNRFKQRNNEVQLMYKDLLSIPFDFTIDEKISVDYDQMEYALTSLERKEKWRKQLKLSTLGIYYDKIEEEKAKQEKDKNYIKKSNEAIELESRELTENNLNNYFEIMEDLTRNDWFTSYLNAFVTQFDPHTFYFAPEDKDRFDMSMSGKFEGIGARLSKRDQAIKIVDIISGGPIWRDKTIHVGDEIRGVRQEDGDPVDITGMRLDDAIKLIKGPKGTTVYLTIKRVDGNIEVVPVVRDLVIIEESYAKTSIIKKGDKVFGLIDLPKFYVDFRDYKERNAAHDIKKEILKLIESNADGLILDLRFNGGGSLQTVVDISGYFIDKGPIVQVKSTGDRKEILRDQDAGVLWDKPLVILVNEMSASASEIFAAAMQDYKRAVVLGSEQTFGKGTVQNVIDLNRFISNSTYGNIGALKITTDKFYRINGGSVQLEGVKSDIIAPDRYRYVEFGEKDEENPLDWDRILPAEYSVWSGYLNYDETIQKSQNRIDNNPIFALTDENAKWVQTQQELMNYSLNYDQFVNRIETNKDFSERFKAISDYKSNLSFSNLPQEQALYDSDETFKETRSRWLESLRSDIYIDEAVRVLEDLHLNFINLKPLAVK